MEEEKKETIVLSDMETRVREIQTPSSLPRIAFSIKKTERVVSAIHLLTDRLDASNSFKEHIRNCSLSFLSLISYGTENESVRRQLSSLFSLIRVGNLSGFFSNSQADLINGELLQIWSAIRTDGVLEKPDLPRNFFDHSAGSQESFLSYKKINEPTPKKTSSNNTSIDPSKGQQKKKQFLATEHKSNLISSFMQKGNIYSIKDIANGVPSLGEKTIQRELLALALSGKVLKSGERRWSRYRLV